VTLESDQIAGGVAKIRAGGQQRILNRLAKLSDKISCFNLSSTNRPLFPPYLFRRRRSPIKFSLVAQRNRRTTLLMMLPQFAPLSDATNTPVCDVRQREGLSK